MTTDDLEGQALTTAEAIRNFLSGRKAQAPPLPQQDTWEKDISSYGQYESQTLDIYAEIYEPRVKELRDKFATQRGVTNQNLENFYQSPRSSVGIRNVADGLVELAKQAHKR